jgi:hypothetical protein
MSSAVQQGRYDSALPPEARQFYDQHQIEIRGILPLVLAKLSGSDEAENCSIAQKEITLLIPGINFFPKLIENVAITFVCYSKHHKSSTP